ncbi:MAG: hypothetical protein FWD74_08065 [Actinomycetia bacterium]|nr:hypothetical protein [Actinomycetes bacterium]
MSARPLPGFWFVGEFEAMAAWSLAHTPTALRVRGVVLDESELVAV